MIVVQFKSVQIKNIGFLVLNGCNRFIPIPKKLITFLILIFLNIFEFATLGNYLFVIGAPCHQLIFFQSNVVANIVLLLKGKHIYDDNKFIPPF